MRKRFMNEMKTFVKFKLTSTRVSIYIFTLYERNSHCLLLFVLLSKFALYLNQESIFA